MFTKIPLKGGDEQDALTPSRYYYKYLTRSGAIKKAKKTYNRRFRKKAKLLLQERNYENI